MVNTKLIFKTNHNVVIHISHIVFPSILSFRFILEKYPAGADG
jgi:hypothetical protein